MTFASVDGTQTRNTDVMVQRNIPNENDLSWSTLHNLGYSGPPLGTPKATVIALLELLRQQKALGTIYVTPMSKVVSQEPSGEFFRISKREQGDWRRYLSDCLFSSSRVKSHYSKSNALIRQLEFTGVMIVAGKHVFPNCWPHLGESTQDSVRVGQFFGKLVVIENLPKGYCRCRCQCPSAKQTIVRKKHLLAGRTKSCGCERIKQEARVQMKKLARGRS